MKRILSLALAGALVLALPGCGASAQVEELSAQPLSLSREELSAQEDQAPAVSAALTGFGLALLQGARGEGEEAVLVSPLSAALALSMAANGAQGETLGQLEAVLSGGAGLDALNALCQGLTEDCQDLGGSTECSIANSLWVDPEGMVREDFIGRCRGTFGAQVLQAELSDPAIVPALNGWVSDHTEGMISEIVREPFRENTAALLVNALYLKNTWAAEFDPLDTWEMDFTHAGGEVEAMDFLHHFDRELPYLETEEAQGVLLPYDDGRLAFFAALPKLYPDAPDFETWLAGLDGAALGELLQSQEEALFLRLSLPKFQAEWSGELREVLAGLGLDLAFDPDRADFSLLGEDPRGYFLSQVIHAARLEVNEEGTRAAAATVVAANAGAAPPPPEGVELDLDRPFLYGIVDTQTGVPLFLGSFG